jgi:hypothetical protein
MLGKLNIMARFIIITFSVTMDYGGHVVVSSCEL